LFAAERVYHAGSDALTECTLLESLADAAPGDRRTAEYALAVTARHIHELTWPGGVDVAHGAGPGEALRNLILPQVWVVPWPVADGNALLKWVKQQQARPESWGFDQNKQRWIAAEDVKPATSMGAGSAR
jgi:hypothetical protein